MHVLWEVVMTHKRIPKDWVIKRSTPFFTKENVPSALLTHHNTAAGVFGQLCVMEGTVTYYGFADENATDAANLKEMRAAAQKEDIEIVGERLRKACGLQEDDE